MRIGGLLSHLPISVTPRSAGKYDELNNLCCREAAEPDDKSGINTFILCLHPTAAHFSLLIYQLKL